MATSCNRVCFPYMASRLPPDPDAEQRTNQLRARQPDDTIVDRFHSVLFFLMDNVDTSYRSAHTAAAGAAIVYKKEKILIKVMRNGSKNKHRMTNTVLYIIYTYQARLDKVDYCV